MQNWIALLLHCKRCSDWHCFFFFAFLQANSSHVYALRWCVVNVIRPYSLSTVHFSTAITDMQANYCWFARTLSASAHTLSRKIGNSFKFAHVIRFHFAPVITYVPLFSYSAFDFYFSFSSNVCQVANKYRKRKEIKFGHIHSWCMPLSVCAPT